MRHRMAGLAAAALSLAGCGGDSNSRTIEIADGGTVTVPTAAGGGLTAQAAEIARTLPAYAPLYPGSTVISTLDAEGASGGGKMVTLETRDPLDKVLAFYDERIAAAGGESTLRTQTADTGVRAVRLADGSGGMISVASDGRTTTIGIVHGQQM